MKPIRTLRLSLVIMLVAILATGAVSAQPAYVKGLKFYDFDQEGDFDSVDYGLQGWNISVFWLNGTPVPGKQDITGPDGDYNITGLDPYLHYYVNETLKPGWINTTPTSDIIGFTLCGGGPDGEFEFFTTAEDLNVFMPTVVDGTSQVLLGYNARIGNAVTQTGIADEFKISYPLGMWNAGQSSFGLSPNGDYSWINNTYVPFNATWVPGVTLYQDAQWDIDGNVINQNSNHDRPDAVPVRDILIRLHSENPNYIAEVNNLTLKQGPYTYSLANSYLPFSEINDTHQDLYLLLRASDAIMAAGGQDIGSGGFSFTGDIRFTWPPGPPDPQMNDIKVDIYIGHYNCNTINFQVVNFGNYAEGNISGYKLDENGNGLAGWNITATRQNPAINLFDVTDAFGFYTIENVPFYSYSLNETLSDWPGWIPIAGNRTVELNQTVPVLTNQNFTNTNQLFCIEGYKTDNCSEGGLAGWNVTLSQDGFEVGNATTNETGYYQICNLTPGNYTICEQLQAGWVNISPICQNITISNSNLTGLNFTNTQLLCISGYKLDMCNGGLGDWQINLTNGSYSTSTTTEQDGFYQFCGLVPGQYNLSETLMDGYMAGTGPTNPVTLTCNENLTNQNFTNTKLLCISGYKLDTCNGGLEGWQINLTNSTGGLVDTTSTDGTGFYQFCGLLPGNYNVTEVLQSGYVAGDSPGPIILTCNQNSTANNFTNTKLLCISGFKRQHETGEGLPDWNITVSIQGGQGTTVQTDGTGYYQVCNLTPGNYTVCEELQPGWINVSPTCVDIVLNCTNATVDFENDPEVVTFCIDGYKIDNCTKQGLPFWNITLKDELDVEVANTTTGPDGYYQFCELLPGNYMACETLKAGWVNLTALCQPAIITNANVTNLNFTNTEVFCIEGRKTIGTTQTGLPNWNITVSNQGGQVATVQTDATGYYQVCNLVPGNYMVCEELQPGWTNLSPVCQNVTLPCENLTVNFANEQNTFCIDGYKIDNCTGRGLQSWNITLKNELDVEVANTTTGPDGYYQFCGLLPGDYTVCEVLKPGWVNLTSLCQPATITNANVTNLNFTNTPLLCISGYKRQHETGQGLSGWNITVRNVEGAEVGNTTTNATGWYQVCNLLPGSYTVCEQLKAGWVNVSPTCVDVVLNCTNATVDFENDPEIVTFCIDGYKIDNCTERGLLSWNITLKDELDVEVANTTTGPDGYYQFCGLLPGDYTVCEVLKPGWVNLTALCQPVTITNANVTNLNFTNTQVFCIEGRKTIGTTQTGLPNWNITVSNQGGQVAKVQTNATGYYKVCNLKPGSYTVCEELKPGWTNLTPVCQNVTLPCENLTVNFGNMQNMFCIDGYKIDNCTGLGIPSWNISVKNETAAVVATTSTDANGHYQVCGLLPGNYTVCEELKGGWMNLTALCRPANITSANVTNLNFTNTRLICIEGRKINGINGAGLANWNITVSNQSGQVVTVQTNATGYYKVCDLKPGIYTVCEELKPGWINVTKSCYAGRLNCSNATNLSFSNIPIVPNGSISGYKINQSCNCTIPGWTIRLYNATTGYLVSMTKTDATGKYSFTGVPFGSYWVNESPQEAWAAISPPHVQVNISVKDPYAVNINFTNFRNFTCNSSDVIIVDGVEKHVICIWDP